MVYPVGIAEVAKVNDKELKSGTITVNDKKIKVSSLLLKNCKENF